VRDNGEGRAPRQRPGPAPTTTATHGPAILSDPYGIRSQARERVRAIDRRCRNARLADEAMPMAVWYSQPKGAFYCLVVEGWAA